LLRRGSILGVSRGLHTRSGRKRGPTWSTAKHRPVSRLTNYPFHFPREHVLKLLIHLSEVSPVGCGRFEFDARFAIAERSLPIAERAASARHPDFNWGGCKIECGVGGARFLVAQLISVIVGQWPIPEYPPLSTRSAWLRINNPRI